MQRYKIDDCISPTTGIIPVDPRMSATYKDAAELVGKDGPKKNLLCWLADSQRNLKVVSIVGFGGVGKTTLAKQVYDEIGGQFSCKAFVSVSQRPDLTRLLSKSPSWQPIARASGSCRRGALARTREGNSLFAASRGPRSFLFLVTDRLSVFGRRFRIISNRFGVRLLPPVILSPLFSSHSALTERATATATATAESTLRFLVASARPRFLLPSLH
jgi:hypothetical protein